MTPTMATMTPAIDTAIPASSPFLIPFHVHSFSLLLSLSESFPSVADVENGAFDVVAVLPARSDVDVWNT
jgi:hypothetical protein